MTEKVCFKCGQSKPLDDFYKHPRMLDGHVNKCKECNKKDIKGNYEQNILDSAFIKKERKRGRNKYHRLYGIGYNKSNPEANKKWLAKYPEKGIARKYNTTRYVTDGFEGHHWSYNIEHVKYMIELTKKHHMKAHRFLVYDQERMMYRRFDTNELLDTKEKHEIFIRHCIEHEED